MIKRNTDYALRALTHMAAQGDLEPHRLRELAAATGAPETFLRKVVQRLDAAGIVDTKRGPGGGVSLSRAPADISVLEVVEAVQGPVAVNKCFIASRECDNRAGCVIRSSLVSVQERMIEIFKTTTVGGLAG